MLIYDLGGRYMGVHYTMLLIFYVIDTFHNTMWENI